MSKKSTKVPRIVVPKNATLRQIYAKVRKEFSADDLQKFTEIEPMIPAKELLAELETIHRVEVGKRREKNDVSCRR